MTTICSATLGEGGGQGRGHGSGDPNLVPNIAVSRLSLVMPLADSVWSPPTKWPWAFSPSRTHLPWSVSIGRLWEGLPGKDLDPQGQDRGTRRLLAEDGRYRGKE